MKVFIFFFFVYIIIVIVLPVESTFVPIFFIIASIQCLQQLTNDRELVVSELNPIQSITSRSIEHGCAKDVEKQVFPMTDVLFDRRGLLRKVEWLWIRVIRMSASEPHEQRAGFSSEPGQRVEGSLCQPICGLTDHSELGLTDRREGPGSDVLDSEKTSGTDQLKRKKSSATARDRLSLPRCPCL